MGGTTFIRDKYGKRLAVSADTHDFIHNEQINFKNKLNYIGVTDLFVPTYSDEGPRGRTQVIPPNASYRDSHIRKQRLYTQRLNKWRIVIPGSD